MNTTGSSEFFWLVLTLVMTALLWLPYIFNRIWELGVWATLSAPNLQPKAAWADRLMRVHRNAIENLAVFAPLVLALGINNIHTTTTVTACTAYFWSRLTHVLAYTAAIPVARTLAFLAGFICQMALAYTLLQHLKIRVFYGTTILLRLRFTLFLECLVNVGTQTNSLRT